MATAHPITCSVVEELVVGAFAARKSNVGMENGLSQCIGAAIRLSYNESKSLPTHPVESPTVAGQPEPPHRFSFPFIAPFCPTFFSLPRTP
jgi:hypothetical protein